MTIDEPLGEAQPATRPTESEHRSVDLSRFRNESLPAPAWEHGEDQGSLRFTAVPSRTWVFGVVIAVVTLGAGAAVSVAAILLTPDSAGAARILIIAAALCLCLPLMLLVKAPFRARTVPVTFAYDPDSLTITIGSVTRRVSLLEVDRLIWCTGTEYSRVVLDGARIRCSLLAGIARPALGHRSDLPEMPIELRRALEKSGLSATASTPGYIRLQR